MEMVIDMRLAPESNADEMQSLVSNVLFLLTFGNPQRKSLTLRSNKKKKYQLPFRSYKKILSKKKIVSLLSNK